MRVADGDRKRIGGIGRQLAAAGQQHADHRLNLRFVGMAVTGHRLLDAVGGVFGNAKAALGQGQHRSAPRLAELQRRGGIFIDEGFLDRRFIGMMCRPRTIANSSASS